MEWLDRPQNYEYYKSGVALVAQLCFTTHLYARINVMSSVVFKLFFRTTMLMVMLSNRDHSIHLFNSVLPE